MITRILYRLLVSALFLFAWFNFTIYGQGASSDATGQIQLTAGWELQDAARVSESGDAISRDSFQAAGWQPATVLWE
jgi:hypothetical protein